jgi:hypothetical protein
MVLHGAPEGRTDRVGRDVVMGGTDPAGGEHIGEARPERVHRSHDLGLDVGNTPRLAKINAERAEKTRDGRDIHVLRAAGQDLVADDEHGGG